MKFITIIAYMLLATPTMATDTQPNNIFRGEKTIASTRQAHFPPTAATDGVISRQSTWLSNIGARPPHILEVTLSKYYNLDSVVIYTGIPEHEKSSNEKLQAAGFWCMKNFKLQYWDDANWTDIPETETTENRKERITFKFAGSITTFRLRLSSVDGEPVRICEFEGYGKENKNMASPTATERTIAPGDSRNAISKNVTARVLSQTDGKTMKYVGYNQGYYMPGSNISAWVEYSNVNSLRVWASLTDYVPTRYVSDNKVNSLADFDNHKNVLRANPLSNNYIAWDSIAMKASAVQQSANTMILDYALEELKRLNIDVILQVSDTKFDSTWANKWQQWQRYYALAFYAARKGNVAMFAMQNEPNHAASGPMRLDQWIEAMRIVSDAVHCAIDDLNKLENKHLTAQFIGPVTAGTNTNWWSSIAKAERINYRGEACDNDLIDIFSTHSYNLPAAGYTSKVQSISRILADNHPHGATKPIVFTEIGRWMNAYLIDKHETMDSPSLFTEWAGIYTNNMRGGGYGMWAFKMANTVSGTYPRGIKSGHHNTWKGRRVVEDEYINLALNKSARAIGYDGCFDASLITDGNKCDSSSWRYTSDQAKWIEIDLENETTIGGAAVYTGSSYGVFTGTDRIKELRLEAWVNNQWQVIEGTQETKCKYVHLLYVFNKPVYTSKIRLVTEDKNEVIVREIKLFPQQIANAQESFDITSTLRTAQTVRLFAKGFKQERPLLRVDVSGADSDMDICCSIDSVTGNRYIWIVQRNISDYTLSLDLSSIGVREETPIVCETVDADNYGNAQILRAESEGKLNIVIPKQSVTLLTIAPYTKVQKLTPCTQAAVRAGAYRNKRFTNKPLNVELNSGDESANSVVYIGFDLRKVDIKNINRIVLNINGECPNDNRGAYRLLAYAMGSRQPLVNRKMRWNSAPNIHPSQSRMVNVGKSTFIAGEMVFSPTQTLSELDITEVVKNHPAPYLTIALIREVRESGDDNDNGRKLKIISNTADSSPMITFW